jgi:3-deoxy-D-manno-octulosonic acid kinase
VIRERWERTATAAMLYDARHADQFDARWFDPAHWSAAGKSRATDGGRGASWFIDGPAPWVLRRYLRGGLVGRVLDDGYLWLGEARARPFAEWRLLAWACDAGLPVVRPVGARVERRGLVYRGALITERVDARSLATRSAAGAPDAALWRAAGAAVARCHAAGLDHADLNLHNLLVADDGRCWVIDLDRGARHATRGAWCEANLARLRRSLSKVATGWDDATRAVAWRAFEDGYSSL